MIRCPRRHRILDYLSTHAGARVAQVVRACGVEATHVRDLARQGYITLEALGRRHVRCWMTVDGTAWLRREKRMAS